MQGPRTPATACAVIAGIEAAQMIRNGQVLGITRKNLHGQAWVFGATLTRLPFCSKPSDIPPPRLGNTFQFWQSERLWKTTKLINPES